MINHIVMISILSILILGMVLGLITVAFYTWLGIREDYLKWKIKKNEINKKNRNCSG